MPSGDDRELVEIAAGLVPLATEGCTIDLREQTAHADGTPPSLVCVAASHVAPALERDLFDIPNRGPLEAASRCAIIYAGEHVGEVTAWSTRPLPPLGEALVCSAAAHVAALLETRALRHRAQVAEVERSAIIAMVGHEVRAPLQTLTVGLELVQMRIRDAADDIPREWLTQRCEQLSRSVTRLTDVATRLLDVARHESNVVAMEANDHDLGAIVEDVIARIRHDTDWAGAVIEVTEQGELTGQWDRLHVETVIENLITNAMKYGGGSPIAITVAGSVGHVTIEVQDHGAGIREDDVPRIFERFFRGSTIGRQAGLGVGLWIVKRLVEAHDGTITCDSKEGAGTTFRVELPRNVRPSDWVRERSGSRREGPGR